MARIVKQEEYAARRNEILEAAQRLVYTKGYERMTIQDILEDLQIAKGTFFHYFSSKGVLLEALVERMVDEIEPLLISVVQDPRLSALEKLQRYFDTAVRWKTARKSLMLSLLRVWYADQNAIVRQKVFTTSVKRIKPLLTEIIRQGIREGVLNTYYPDQVAEVVLYLLQGLGDAFVVLLLPGEPNPDDLRGIENAVAAYTDALERVLGAPRASLTIIDSETLKEWFSRLDTGPTVPGEVLTEGIEVSESGKTAELTR